MSRARVIVGLGGRLGNQMFQYAAGKALAMRLDASLAFEGYGSDSKKKSRVQIFDAFGISANFTAIRSRRADKIRVKLARLGLPVRMRGLPIYVEPHYQYDSRFESLKSGRYLIGAWQSSRYFEGIRQCLLDDFSFKGELSGGARDMEKAIAAAACPVAVHVRRGDFVNNPRILDRHGLCERDYYESAMQVIRSAHSDSTFFVFSDDIERVKEEFAGLNDLVFVSGNTQEEDLHLMSSCRHNIIANSTFSWWAAWLNPHPDKIVVAPRQWMGPKMLPEYDPKDLYPADWCLI